jgi:Ni,Fe-hydrogenase I small subunit
MKYCAISAGALGLTTSALLKIEKALATDYPGGTHVVWLNGAACTGCTVSLTNTINAYSIQGLLAPLDAIEQTFYALNNPQLGPNGPLDMDFMETLNSAVGARAVDAAFTVLNSKQPFALCLEGAIQTADEGRYCQIWRVNKEHSVLAAGSWVWASADREALKVPNTITEPIKAVNPITLTDDLPTNDKIELHPGSVLAAKLWSGATAPAPASLPFPWQSAHDYLATGAQVIPLSAPNGYVYELTTYVGSTDVPEPTTWPTTLGDWVNDNGNIWTAVFAYTIVEANSWVEKLADRSAIGPSLPSYAPDNKTGAAVPILTSITLTGRLELAAGSILAPDSKISSCSLVYSAADRVAIGTGIYATATPKSVEPRTILEDITLTGTVMIAAGSVLTAGTVLTIGSWVEDSVPLQDDRAAIGGAYDVDNKIKVADVTLGSTVTLTGRIEAVKGSVLDAYYVHSANYLKTAGDEDRSFADEVLNFAISPSCAIIIAVGTCASYGGIPAANGSVTDARGLISTGAVNEGACGGTYCKTDVQGYWDYLLAKTTITRAQWEALMCKTVCVPGCPPHPDWIVGVIAYFLQFGSLPTMDKYHRPLSYYGEYQCTHCLWRTNNTEDPTCTPDLKDIDGNAPLSKSGRQIGNSPKLYYYKYDSSYEGCIGILGCKGRKTKADCSYRRWNGEGPGALAGQLIPNSFTTAGDKAGVSWCVLSRAGCHGCTEPRFPDGWGPFFMYH